MNLNLIFPFNKTYEVLDGPLPIVFSVNRPDLANLLQLQLNYSLVYSVYNDHYIDEKKVTFAEVLHFGNGSTPTLSMSTLTDGENLFFVYSMLCCRSEQ